MKKVMALALALVMVLGTLTACGGSNDSNGSNDSGNNDNVNTPTGAKVIEINLTEEQYAFGVDKNQPELLEDVNAFIKKIKEDGTFDAICNKYFGDGTPEAVVSAELDETKDQLVVATNAAFAPFEYTEDGGNTYYGIDMEIANLLAKELGKELVIMDMDFDAVCLNVQQEKCDIAMAGLTVTEKRMELVNFSDSYYDASQQLVVLAGCTDFDACTTAADVEKILNEKDASCKIGVQRGTTGQLYTEGDEDWGFAGYAVTCVPYANGSLAIQDLLNTGVDYVIIDSAPAAKIVEAINAVQ